MRDQRVVSLAERIFAAKVQTYVGDTRPSMQGIITTMARASIEAAEEFYKALQGSGHSRNDEPGHAHNCVCFICSR